MPNVIWIIPTWVVFAALLAGQEHPTFQTGVSEVHVDVGVVDRDGRAVTGLVKGDFRVFDEGQEHMPIAFAAEEQQIDIILLLDTSGSMRNQIARVASAAREAFQELREGDRVSVMTFTSKARLVTPFTADLDSVQDDIRGIISRPFHGNTQIREAIYEAATYFLQSGRSQRRRTILVITDNIGGHKRSEAAVVTSLWEADAVLSGIVVPQHRPRGVPSDPIVERLSARLFPGIGGIAQKTGGEVLHSDDPGGAFSQMMQRIRSRYSLYYPTPNGMMGSVRTVRVELTAEARERNRGAQVLARRVYTLKR